MARVLIGYSACPLTRAAFEAHGHDAWTCDLLPARDGSTKHLQMDVWHAVLLGWDFGVFHPMCTVMTVSSSWALKDPDFERYPGVGYHQKLKPETLRGKERRDQQQIEFENFRRLRALPFPVAIENPAPSMISTNICKPDQVFHPHHFGDDASKGTGLWLTGDTPKLVLKSPEDQAAGRLVEWPEGSGRMVRRWANQTDGGQNNLSPGADRWLQRSQTYPGVADAMGDQWGRWLLTFFPDRKPC